LNGDKGHDGKDVMYVAFKGTTADTVPGAKGAKWTAKNAKDFEDSIKVMGDKLVAKLF